MPPQQSPWYDHPYVKLLHGVLTGLLTAALIASVTAYFNLRADIEATRVQLAVLCSKIDLVYNVVVETPLKTGGQQP